MIVVVALVGVAALIALVGLLRGGPRAGGGED